MPFLGIFQTGNFRVLKTIKTANFQNFLDGPLTNDAGRVLL